MAGMPRRRTTGLCLALIGLICLAAAPATGAATILLGAPGGGNAGGGSALNLGANPITVANTSLGEPGAHVTSPVTGTIVRWRITTLGTGAFTLHVLRPTSPGPYIEVSSTPGNVAVSGANTFSAGLPIQAGELIAVDIPGGKGIVGHSGIPGSEWERFSPAFTSGSTATPAGSPSTGAELLFNADVTYTPASDPKLGSLGASAAGCGKKRKRSAKAAKAKRKCRKRKR